jgi:tripartite-type tricarboxylate transporter receptor subunit TctC
MAPTRLLIAMSALTVALDTSSAAAQDYPARPVRFVVGFAAGGASDTVARIVGQKLAESWGQNVVVDNRTGAGGTIAADMVVKAQPDGYTIFVGDFGPSVLAGSLYAKLPYDPFSSFAHVTRMVTFPLVLLVPAASPLNSVRDLIAQAKAKPGALRYSSSGIGTSPHLFLEMINMTANVSTTPIHYKGGAPALIGLIAGEGDYSMVSVSTALAQLSAGKVRAIGVTSARPVSRLPNVPPIGATLPGYDAVAFYGLHAPAQTPAAIVAKLHQEVGKVLARAEVKERLDGLGMEVAPSASPQEFTAYVRKQIDTWTAVAKAANVRAE